jgi:D-alanyl-D-alanine carboxypeptidase/D-alanyl-D-alanine-endopeptidase (penicillin-binding protein 4)
LPQKTSVDLTIKLLSDTLKKTVVRSDLQLPESHKTIYSTPLDSLIAPMMIHSDNFIAEQLVLVASGILTDSLLTENLIRQVQENDFSDLPDPLNWVDGSGLSRYNLFTPRSVIKVWEKIYESVGQTRLKSLIANGGINGTIRNLYADDKPFVFAKTGSLRNNHSLSGLIVTDKGRMLLFSYMNSNYTRPSSEIKTAMDKVLRIVKQKY